MRLNWRSRTGWIGAAALVLLFYAYNPIRGEMIWVGEVPWWVNLFYGILVIPTFMMALKLVDRDSDDA